MNTLTTYKTDRAKLEADIVAEYRQEIGNGTMRTVAYNIVAAKNNMGWWQVYYIIRKARKSGEAEL